MTFPTRVRINLDSKEFEVEGTESFVQSYTPQIKEFLDSFSLSAARLGADSVTDKSSSSSRLKIAPNADLPETFGEYFFNVPKDAFGKDQILVAGHFAQVSSEDKAFSTLDASVLLTDQGVKLANPSNMISKNLKAKTLIKLGKGRFRVSPDGLGRIAELRKEKPE